MCVSAEDVRDGGSYFFCLRFFGVAAQGRGRVCMMNTRQPCEGGCACTSAEDFIQPRPVCVRVRRYAGTQVCRHAGTVRKYIQVYMAGFVLVLSCTTKIARREKSTTLVAAVEGER